jgi:hypothetical protein
MPKKWGGEKEAVASVEPGWPREAAQVSGFRGAGNNSREKKPRNEFIIARAIPVHIFKS